MNLRTLATRDHDDGLFRTRLAGHNARTSEAFNVLRKTAFRISDPTAAGFGVYGQTLLVAADGDEGRWELISLRDEIFLSISDCQYAHIRSERVLPEDFIGLHFMMAGPASVDYSETGHVSISSPKLTVVRQGDDTHYQVSCGPGTWRSVSIYVSREYLSRFVEASVGVGSCLLEEFKTIGNEQVLCYQMPVGVAALNAVEQLLDNPYQGYRRLLFAQAKCHEALCASVDLWQSFIESHNTAEVFSSRDLRLIEKAKNLILTDLAHTPTIPSLARAVGTNTSKLKRGFKFLYGMTIFEFGHRYRMNQALHLLTHDKLSINEVAVTVGYRHQTSFTTSFREHFGLTPKDARRMTHTDGMRPRPVADSPMLPTSSDTRT